MDFTSSVKYMFPETDSDTDSMDSDDDSSAQIRKLRQQKKNRQPIRIPLNSAKQLGMRTRSRLDDSERQAERRSVDDGEPGLFVIDSTGGAGNMGIRNTEKKWPEPSPLDPGVDLTKNLYINLDYFGRFSKKGNDEVTEDVNDTRDDELVTELMKKATFKPALEKNPVLPRVSKNEMKRRRQAEREKTKGSDWFNMPATELTEERRRDLEIMQIRDVLDPKRRYRTEDRTVLPKYFQVGTVIEHPADFYNSRIPRKERKQTIVDELLADADLQKRSKRKYAEIIQRKIKHPRRNDTKTDKVKKKRKLKS